MNPNLATLLHLPEFGKFAERGVLEQLSTAKLSRLLRSIGRSAAYQTLYRLLQVNAREVVQNLDDANTDRVDRRKHSRIDGISLKQERGVVLQCFAAFDSPKFSSLAKSSLKSLPSAVSSRRLSG